MSFRALRARRGALVVAALALVVLTAACVPAPSAGPPPASSGGGGGGGAGGIVNGLNAARAQAGLPGFAVDGGMNGNAQFHANRLASGGGGCNNLWHSGELGAWYAGHASGENVACISPCQGNAGVVVGMWLNSPPHRANILNGGYSFVGVGVACNSGAMYAVAQFRS
ncbi:MAG TPA: CAP domain-containing protein [Acidimicrobiia bacterium]